MTTIAWDGKTLAADRQLTSSDFALLAMRMGKTAREAVELAAELDIWTGMGVTELTVDRTESATIHQFPLSA